MLQAVSNPEFVSLIIATTACICFALIVLVVLGIAIFSPGTIKAVAGSAKFGLLALAGICAGVMTTAIKVAAQTKVIK